MPILADDYTIARALEQGPSGRCCAPASHRPGGPRSDGRGGGRLRGDLTRHDISAAKPVEQVSAGAADLPAPEPARSSYASALARGGSAELDAWLDIGGEG